MDEVVQWLQYPDNDRPDFIMLYFNEPDHTGHGDGPDSSEVSVYHSYDMARVTRRDVIISPLKFDFIR